MRWFCVEATGATPLILRVMWCQGWNLGHCCIWPAPRPWSLGPDRLGPERAWGLGEFHCWELGGLFWGGASGVWTVAGTCPGGDLGRELFSGCQGTCNLMGSTPRFWLPPSSSGLSPLSLIHSGGRLCLPLSQVSLGHVWEGTFSQACASTVHGKITGCVRVNVSSNLGKAPAGVTSAMNSC